MEEQVKQGHDVTLFASGGTKTSAKLISFLPKALLEEGVPWKEYLKPYYHLHKALEMVKQQAYLLKKKLDFLIHECKAG